MNPHPGPEPADRAALEGLALSDWSPAAGARVDSVVVEGALAAVNLLVNGDYEYSMTFRRGDDGLWQESSSVSGHTSGSDLWGIDPS